MNEKNKFNAMMTLMKATFSCFLFAVILLTASLNVRAKIATSGVIEDGTNRTEWSYDNGTKTLIIQGTGEMLTGSGDEDWRKLTATKKS